MIKRYIAHITIEADTPLKIGSASSDFWKDSPIQRDWNGLPMILGTSIAGVLRKEFQGDTTDIFGDENGSKVIISNALLINENNQVNEGLLLQKSNFLDIFDTLPIREHTAITDKGVAQEHSKFDEEIVYKGSRFRFSIEMIDNKNSFNEIIELLRSSSFRLGGGSTKGFGKFNILNISTIIIDSIDKLIKYSSSLNCDLSKFEAKNENIESIKSENYTSYRLKITPDDFFIFGSGFGDEEADQTPIYEPIVDYKNRCLSNRMILIPATSIKGALSHRTAYHYNLLNGFFVGNKKAKFVITELFGEAKNSKKGINGAKGNIIFSDCFKKENKNSTKIFDHVAIDRFTSGAIEGALFQEKTITQRDEWNIEILVKKDINSIFIKAFEKALNDICSGLLPLGGATTKGHGVFSGEWSKL